MLIPTLLLLFASLATPQPQALNIPDTPAGHTLKAWLDAFNSGDRATEEKYLKTYDPERSLDDEMRFRGMTGGFILTPSGKFDTDRHSMGSMNDASVLGKDSKRARSFLSIALLRKPNARQISKRSHSASTAE